MSTAAVFFVTESVAAMETLNRANWWLSGFKPSGNVSPKNGQQCLQACGAAVFILNDMFFLHFSCAAWLQEQMSPCTIESRLYLIAVM